MAPVRTATPNTRSQIMLIAICAWIRKTVASLDMTMAMVNQIHLSMKSIDAEHVCVELQELRCIRKLRGSLWKTRLAKKVKAIY